MPNKLAVQMYTLREFTKTAEGLDSCLQIIHGIGYAGVQLSAVSCMDDGGVTAADAKAMLDAHGLRCVATHRSLDRLVHHTIEEIAFHETLDCQYTAVGGAWGYPNNAAEYRRFVQDVHPMIQTLARSGVRFGYHNHAHEFIRDADTSRPAYEVFLDEAPSMYLELDTYWLNHAGLDVASFFRRCVGRIPVIHVKDKEMVEKDGAVMAPVGEGNLDWDSIIEVAEAGGTEWYVVEQDECRRDPFDCLASSFDFLASKQLA